MLFQGNSQTQMDPSPDRPWEQVSVAARYIHRAATPRNELYCLAGETLSLVPFALREQLLAQLRPEDVYGISCSAIFQPSTSEEQRIFFSRLWERAAARSSQKGLTYIAADEELSSPPDARHANRLVPDPGCEGGRRQGQRREARSAKERRGVTADARDRPSFRARDIARACARALVFDYLAPARAASLPRSQAESGGGG